jgi:hypothetical protein
VVTFARNRRTLCGHSDVEAAHRADHDILFVRASLS